MHKPASLIILFTLFASASCMNIRQGDGLAGRWDFRAIDMPDVAGFIDSIKVADEDVGEAMQSFFRGNELVLRKDNSCDLVICKKYLHCAWKFDQGTGMLVLTDEAGDLQPVAIKVNKIEGTRMFLTVDSGNMNKLVPPYQYGATGYSYLRNKRHYTFFLSWDDDSYWQEKNDPYSKVNNLWRIKPHKQETNEQVTERVGRHLKFCKLAVQDAITSNRGYVSFNWFVTPLILSKNGGRLREYSRAREEWESNFYDSAQAKQGYALLEDDLNRSYYQADETKSRFENYVIIIDQLIANLKK